MMIQCWDKYRPGEQISAPYQTPTVFNDCKLFFLESKGKSQFRLLFTLLRVTRLPSRRTTGVILAIDSLRAGLGAQTLIP